MTKNAHRTGHTLLTRWLAAAVLIGFYFLSAIGVSGLAMTAGATSAEARGRGFGGGVLFVAAVVVLVAAAVVALVVAAGSVSGAAHIIMAATLVAGGVVAIIAGFVPTIDGSKV
jgi:hypothetical protein